MSRTDARAVVDGGRIRAAREYYDTLHTSEVVLGG
jgi:ketosteroid isomerase-like protein